MGPKDLEQVDLVTLSRYNKKTGQIDFQDASVLEMPVSRDRLINTGMAEKDGKLTEAGLALAKKVCEAEKRLQTGIPFEKRKKPNPKTMVEDSGSKWYQATIQKKPVCTNGEIVFFGKPERGMSPLKAEANAIKQNIKNYIGKGYQEVWPRTYKISNLGGLEFIILTSEDGKLVVPVQAKYFDFVKSRFSAGRFFAKDEVSAVQVRVQNRGVKDDVIAFIMPCIGVIEENSGKVPKT